MSDGQMLRRLQPGEAVPPDAIDVLGLARRIASGGPRGAISASTVEISALAESLLELIRLAYLTSDLFLFERDKAGEISAEDRTEYLVILNGLEADLLNMGFIPHKDQRHELH